MDNKTEVGFALVKITTEQFAILEGNFEKETEIKLHLNFRFAADNQQKLIAVFSSFAFDTNNKQFLKIEAGCHFAIAPDSWDKMYSSANNEITIPVGFLQHMAMLTVGTTRGILHAKTENTDFNKFPIPTINIAELIKEDNVIKFMDS